MALFEASEYCAVHRRGCNNLSDSNDGDGFALDVAGKCAAIYEEELSHVSICYHTGMLNIRPCPLYMRN